MGNARREPLRQYRSIHLVPKEARGADVATEIPADVLRLTLRLSGQNSMIPAQSSSGDYASAERGDPLPLHGLDPATVLREIFELLEDYSPVWYTEEHHERAVAALKAVVD